MRPIAIFALILAAHTTPTLFAGSKKSPEVTIRLHGEGSSVEGPSFSAEVRLSNPDKKIFMRKVPAVNERDITAFYPFPGNDGLAGAYFRLDAHGTNKLQQFALEEKGRLAIVLVNGRIASAMSIDGARSDGLLYVPGGILPVEIALLQKKFPVIGSESAFGKKPRPAKTEPAP